jgi:hypothetical protein
MAKQRRITTYLPASIEALAQALAQSNQEPISDLIKRLVIPAIQEEASRSFKSRNFISNAIKSGLLTPELVEELQAIAQDKTPPEVPEEDS